MIKLTSTMMAITIIAIAIFTSPTRAPRPTTVGTTTTTMIIVAMITPPESISHPQST